MPRVARTQSGSDLYHVMTRGINQVQLFYDDTDRVEFLSRLWRYRDLCGISVLSWCLMANHVHLLLHANLKDLSAFMKRLQLSYSHYYNERYDREGYLYQGRFKSVDIKDEPQLLSVIRYIHQNPLEAGRPISDWTSFNDILTSSGSTDSAETLSFFSDNPEIAQAKFAAFVSDTPMAEEPLKLPRTARFSDEEAASALANLAGTKSCQAICDLGASERTEVLAKAKTLGMTVRQIARLTGLNRGVVQRARVSGETSP